MCILVLIGYIDLQTVENERIVFKVLDDADNYTVGHSVPKWASIGVNEDRRIKTLIIFNLSFIDNPYDLPAIIKHLGTLVVLYLMKCRSLPIELSNLEVLKPT